MIDMLELESAIIDAKSKYDSVYSVTIGEDVFIWRLLTQKEYEIIDKSCTSDKYIREEMVCQYTVVYPKGIVFSTYKAGVATQLAEKILYESGFNGVEKAYSFLDACREDMARNFVTQAGVVVAAAFPQYRLDEIESWDIEKLIDMVSKAEWKLNVIDGKPFSFQKLSDIPDSEEEQEEQESEDERLKRIEQEVIELGGDPILVLYEDFYKKDKPYASMPFIMGRWWDREDVVNAVRKEIHKRTGIDK